MPTTKPPKIHPVAQKVRAGYALFWLTAPDPAEADEAIVRAVRADERIAGHRLLRWRLADGIAEADTEGRFGAPDSGAADVVGFFATLEGLLDRPTVVWAHDLHLQLGVGGPPHEVALASLKRVLPLLRASGSTLALVGAQASSIPEVRALGPVVDLPFPGVPELASLVTEFGEANGLTDRAQSAVVAEQLRGLTATQAVDVLAEALLLGQGTIDASAVGRLKAQEIAKGGVLQLHEPLPGGLDSVGGLAVLKQWVLRRREAFGDEAREFGLPAPRGLLLIGVQGAGKSTAAKAVATALGVPLVRLDLGRVMAGIVGSSEANAREAIRVAESIAPCVLWMDEVEKGLVGAMSGLDSGAGAKVLGTLLTWMAEKTSPVFVAATANDVSKIPPEFLRKGRFDAVMFVDLPGPEERAEILAIHTAKRGRGAVRSTPAFLSASDGYTGAEIEAAVVEALYRCFDDGRRDLMIGDVVEALAAEPPLSQTMREQVQALRAWANGRCLNASTGRATPDVPNASKRRVLS